MTDIESLEAALAAPANAATAAIVGSIAARFQTVPVDAPQATRSETVRGLRMLAEHHYRNGQVAHAGRALQAAGTLSQDLEAPVRVGLLLHRADFELMTWDIGAALDHSSAALPIARQAGLRIDEVRVWINYGVALQAAGMAQQADKRLAHALQLLDGIDDPRMSCNIWALRSQLGFHENEQALARAMHACERTLHFAQRSPERFRASSSCFAYCNWAALSLMQPNPMPARSYLDEAAAQPNLGMRHKWLIGALDAMLAVRLNNGPKQRAALDALLAPDRVPARSYAIETFGLMASMYTLMQDSEHANAALVKLSAERASALWATINEPGALDAQPAGGNAFSVSSMGLLERLAITAELRDDETGRHCYRVGRLARLLAQRAGISQAQSDLIDTAARLHDIGKFAVPDAILLKPGPLNHAEMQLMRTHASIGANLLASRASESLTLAEQIARSHHEHWNGGGYPMKLAGEAIPLVARIAAIADVYDALTHKRPYKPAWSHQDSVAYIQHQRGQQFDPQLTDHFLAMMNEASGDLTRFLADQEAAADHSPYVVAGMRLES
jgi:putative nucleotidyltransferase with HDIG domain